MQPPLANEQDPAAKLDWTFDWSEILEVNGSPTISSATATTDITGAVVTGTAHDATKVTCVLACPTVPLGTVVGLTTHIVLSSGEEDERTHHIEITNR